MKNTILALCFLAAVSAFGETRRVVSIKNENWQSQLLATSHSADASVRLTNCMVGYPGDTATLSYNGSTLATTFDSNLCLDGGIGVVGLETTGDVELKTLARFSDSYGNKNVVVIPELKNGLGPDADTALYRQWLDFPGILNDNGYITSVAIFTDKLASVTITVYDGLNEIAGTETLNVAPPYTFYRLGTKVPIGRITINRTFLVCSFCSQPVELRAVVFVGGEVGSPMVLTGSKLYAIATP